MSNVGIAALLGGREGRHVVHVERLEKAVPEVWVSLESSDSGALICDGCGNEASDVHEVVWRRVRDPPIPDATTWLLVPRRRVACRRCGPRLERLPWPGRYARVTRRLADGVARLCPYLSLKRVAAFFGLSRGTVKAIDKRHLKEMLGPVDLAGADGSGLEALAAFARKLEIYLPGILALAKRPLHTSLLEGIDNKIRSSSERPTVSATTTITSSKSATLSPVFGEEPKLIGNRIAGPTAPGATRRRRCEQEAPSFVAKPGRP